MNIAIILAGGTGSRMGGEIPKQYIEVSGKPVFSYCLKIFQTHKRIDAIVIVAAKNWQDYITKWVNNENISKFQGFAQAGSSRQHSIVNGIIKAKEIGAKGNDVVIIHDAARPCVSDRLISECIEQLDCYDGVMPVLPVKDTIYLSTDRTSIASLLDRDQLFAGQSPESFLFNKYLAIHNGMNEEQLSLVRGSSEIAFRNGLRIKLINGDEHNYKITTMADLEKFKSEVE